MNLRPYKRLSEAQAAITELTIRNIDLQAQLDKATTLHKVYLQRNTRQASMIREVYDAVIDSQPVQRVEGVAGSRLP